MSKKTVNTKNLEALGAELLAALLLELCGNDREVKRRVRLELTFAAGPRELAKEVGKRLSTIGRARSYVDWTKEAAFARDLQTQIDMIAEKIAPDAPEVAFELIWQFITLAPSVYERVDDSRGTIGDVFRYAITCFGDVAPRAGLDGAALADRVFDALEDNGYGQWDDLLAYVGVALGLEGVARLKVRVDAYQAVPLPDDPSLADRAVHISGGRFGYSLDRNWPAQRKASRIADWRREIADLEGDVDAFLAASTDLENPYHAAEAAQRLVSAGRAAEALELLIRARDASGQERLNPGWDEAYVATLDTLGRIDDLRAFHWDRFAATLSARWLRDLLKSLPDFEDVEKEEDAKNFASSHHNLHAALAFFLEWPDHPRAASLIAARAEELDGDAYYLLTPAADAMEANHPLAAVICRRTMIRYTLDRAKSTRYKHAIRHARECRSADARIEDYGSFETHEAFMAKLRQKHGRKSAFWSEID